MIRNETKSENAVADARMAMAAELLANPDFHGTKDDIAREAGVSRATLYRWLRNPDFIAIVNSLVSQYADAELGMVWKALCRRIQAGDIQAIKLYFELRERGAQKAAVEARKQEDKPASKLYNILGEEDGTDYEAVTEAETGDEVGAPAGVSE